MFSLFTGESGVLVAAVFILNGFVAIGVMMFVVRPRLMQKLREQFGSTQSQSQSADGVSELQQRQFQVNVITYANAIAGIVFILWGLAGMMIAQGIWQL